MSNTENATPEPDDGDAPTSRSSRRRRGLAIGSSLALVLVAGIGFMVWRQVEPLVSAKYRSVTYTVPTAPQLTPASGQKVYRIDPAHSSLGYEISEKLIGASTGHATGVTNGIAGDILIDPTTPSNSKVGKIVVNLEQLHSDNNLRDARIRQDFLQSHDHPLATFAITSVKGLPATLVEGKTYPLTLVGTATVRNKTAPVTWTATASVDNGKLTAKATTHVKLSTFDIGPINLQGLVSTGDDVTPAARRSRAPWLRSSSRTAPRATTPARSARCTGCSTPPVTRPRCRQASRPPPRRATCRHGPRPTRACRCRTR
jgi:polyisoprenoid-binding protein YceI